MVLNIYLRIHIDNSCLEAYLLQITCKSYPVLYFKTLYFPCCKHDTAFTVYTQKKKKILTASNIVSFYSYSVSFLWTGIFYFNSWLPGKSGALDLVSKMNICTRSMQKKHIHFLENINEFDFNLEVHLLYEKFKVICYQLTS